jgi:hypothetical protein
MSNKIKNIKILDCFVFLILALSGIFLRLLPYHSDFSLFWNFSPIWAIALFGGFYFSKKTAFLLTIIIMVISDVFIGYYQAPLMAIVYGSILLSVFLGAYMKNNKKWQIILGGSILSAVIFFITTNFAVWAFSSWYARDITGLWQCYLMGLPFLRNSLLGNLFYTSIIFGTYVLAKVLFRKISLEVENKTTLV